MPTKVTTDWHIAVKRSGGTTPTSQSLLGQELLRELESALGDEDHLIAGDLLDAFTVETADLVALFKILSEWLTKYGRKLAVMRGNHDYAERGGKVSSFDLLGHILSSQFPDQVTIANEVTYWKQFILVPHLPNNDILTMEFDKLSEVSGKVIVFHANIDNPFAAGSQHSLNLTLEQVGSLVSRDNLVLCGHEHQPRKLLNSRVLVLGNGFPSSIADCLGNDFKYSTRVTGTNYEQTPTWTTQDYAELDWQDLVETEARFIRIVGEAAAAQASEVVSAVAKYRSKSTAFIVGNAVKIEGVAGMGDFADLSLEKIKSFDVLTALLAELTEPEGAVVRELMND